MRRKCIRGMIRCCIGSGVESTYYIDVCRCVVQYKGVPGEVKVFENGMVGILWDRSAETTCRKWNIIIQIYSVGSGGSKVDIC